MGTNCNVRYELYPFLRSWTFLWWRWIHPLYNFQFCFIFVYFLIIFTEILYSYTNKKECLQKQIQENCLEDQNWLFIKTVISNWLGILEAITKRTGVSSSVSDSSDFCDFCWLLIRYEWFFYKFSYRVMRLLVLSYFHCILSKSNMWFFQK